MNETFVLDACALIAVLSNEAGADKVVDVYKKVLNGEAELVMHVVNLLEVYYDDYRTHGKESAKKMLAGVKALSIKIITETDDELFTEAGRLKANYKISLADSFALAQTMITDGTLLTSDHHELDIIEAKEPIKFLWIR
jgi:PIN domain nuclease of toxin-antitoxin system